MRYGGYASSPCGNDGYGETEDISVYLRPYFWIPWPGFKQQDQSAVQNSVLRQDMILGSARQEEEALPEEVEQRRQLTAPEQTPSFRTVPKTNISVFPNPVIAGQRVTVSGQADKSELVLRNINGQIVKRYSQGTTQAEIPANLPSGVYLLSGVGAERGKSWTKRVVVR
jgi:hypothetical protein